MNQTIPAMSQLDISEADLLRSITKESFYDFVLEFWDEVPASSKLVNNWHIKYLCDELQVIAERVFRGEPKLYDLIINISPGTSKSTIVSIMFPAWIWTRMIKAGIIGASYTLSPAAITLSRKSRELIRCDKYRLLFPEVTLSIDQDSKGQFANIEGGERFTVGVGGNITGCHADFILIDDPLNPKGVDSEADIAAANNFIIDTLWSRKKNKEVTPTILIMQRLHQNDCTAMLLRLQNEGKFRIKHICLPAEKTDKINPPELAKFYVDGLMDPHRLSRAALAEFKVKAFVYAGQFMQVPIPMGLQTFLVEKIRIEEPPKKWKALVRYWDKAGTPQGGCYTVGVLMGQDREDDIWVLDVVRGQWDSASREKKIKQTAEMDRAEFGLVTIGIEQEPGSGGLADAQATIRNLRGFCVKADRPTGDKVARAMPFSYYVNAGEIRMKAAVWNREYLEELQYFPESEYKDQVDASSGAFNTLVGNKKEVGTPWLRK